MKKRVALYTHRRPGTLVVYVSSSSSSGIFISTLIYLVLVLHVSCSDSSSHTRTWIRAKPGSSQSIPNSMGNNSPQLSQVTLIQDHNSLSESQSSLSTPLPSSAHSDIPVSNHGAMIAGLQQHPQSMPNQVQASPGLSYHDQRIQNMYKWAEHYQLHQQKFVPVWSKGKIWKGLTCQKAYKVDQRTSVCSIGKQHIPWITTQHRQGPRSSSPSSIDLYAEEGTEYVVKRVVAQSDLANMMINEFEILKNLPRHPGLFTIVGQLQNDENFYYYVMKYIEGGDAFHFIMDSRHSFRSGVEEEKAKSILKDAGDGTALSFPVFHIVLS